MITFLPKTTLGKWSARLFAAFLGFFGVMHLLVLSGQEGGQGFWDNLYLLFPGLFAGLSAISALIFGVISIFKSKERSVLVLIVTLIGFLILIFIIGEILVPH